MFTYFEYIPNVGVSLSSGGHDSIHPFNDCSGYLPIALYVMFKDVRSVFIFKQTVIHSLDGELFINISEYERWFLQETIEFHTYMFYTPDIFFENANSSDDEGICV